MVCPQPVGPPPGYHSKKVNTDDMTLIGSLGLDRTDEQRNIYIANIPHYDIHVLEQPYPPANCWASESIKATQDWFKTWYPNGVTGVPAKLADSRKPRTLRERAATIQINQTLLRNVVANESVIFEDPSLPLERRVVLIIIRDFVPDKRVVNYIGGHSLDAVTDRINSRVRLTRPSRGMLTTSREMIQAALFNRAMQVARSTIDDLTSLETCIPSSSTTRSRYKRKMPLLQVSQLCCGICVESLYHHRSLLSTTRL